MRSILSLQRAVARAVAEGIEVELSPETEARLAEAPEVNPAAYRHYQRGVQIRAEERGGWRRAREHFERAVAVDPSFALGWAWLAKMHAILGTTGARTEEDLKRKAEAAVQKALALDRDLAEAHVALGLVREILDLDGAAAEQVFVRALELEPGNQEAHFEYGMLLMRMGRMDAAVAEMKRALAVDPFSMHVHHGMIQVYAFSHRFEEAIQQAERALDVEPGDLEGMSRLARTYVFAGRFEEAEAAYRRLEAMDGAGDYEGSFWEAYLHAKKGQPAKARAWIEARENDIAPWTPFWIAWLYAGSGEIDLAVDTLEKAYQTQPNRWNFVFLKALPAFDPLRGEPRFQALVAKTRLG
jgi:serine/threonine-protein kinase